MSNVADVKSFPYNLSCIVDGTGVLRGGTREVNGSEAALAKQKAMLGAPAAGTPLPYDLA